MCQPPLDPMAINISEQWLCGDRVLDKYIGFQKKKKKFPCPEDNTLTILMMYEQESTDLGLSPDSNKYDLDKSKQFNVPGPMFLH